MLVCIFRLTLFKPASMNTHHPISSVYLTFMLTENLKICVHLCIGKNFGLWYCFNRMDHGCFTPFSTIFWLYHGEIVDNQEETCHRNWQTLSLKVVYSQFFSHFMTTKLVYEGQPVVIKKMTGKTLGHG